MNIRRFFSACAVLLGACTFQFETVLATDDNDGELDFAVGGPEIFGAECARCHGSDGNGLEDLGPSLFVVLPGVKDKGDLRDLLENGTTGNENEEIMPPIPLSEQAQDDVIDFVILTFCPGGNVQGESICDN